MDGISAGVAPVAAARIGPGIEVNAAATLAVVMNSRRETGEVFMTGQYNGTIAVANVDFQLVKRFNRKRQATISWCTSTLGRSASPLGQPKSAVPT